MMNNDGDDKWHWMMINDVSADIWCMMINITRITMNGDKWCDEWCDVCQDERSLMVINDNEDELHFAKQMMGDIMNVYFVCSM